MEQPEEASASVAPAPTDDAFGAALLGAGDSGPPPPVDPAVALRQLVQELQGGTIINDKYRVEHIVGHGAMGVVAAAMHMQLRERVALKFLHVRDSGWAQFQARFRREALVSAKLRNEHVARVIDVATWRDATMFMVMEYLKGIDLRELLRAQGRLPIPLALDYVVQICEGLAEAHGLGIVHRDLKPSNLFVTRRMDGSGLIKILDFGISKWSHKDEISDLTQAGTILGSPKYMAPEQLFDPSEVDTRADIWSIGAMAYELITGFRAFDEPSLTRMVAELASDKMPPSFRERGVIAPPELEAVIMRCFARRREERVQNVAELAGALLDAVGAPFAPDVRAKVQAISDTRATSRARGRRANARSARATPSPSRRS